MRLPPGMCVIPPSQLAAWMPAAAARAMAPPSEICTVPCEPWQPPHLANVGAAAKINAPCWYGSQRRGHSHAAQSQ